ncbi:MAG: cysteine peptidase family C39 domain-containing protein [Sedimenticola sp.]
MEDTGCHCLVTVARLQQVPADYAQIRHQFGHGDQNLSDNDLIRASRAIGFKARKVTLSVEELVPTTLPAIAKSHNGDYFVLAKITTKENQTGLALILNPEEQTPKQITLADLESLWTGELILLTKREGLLSAFSEFDIRWFIPAMLKYRKHFSEVLLASFFIQLFALITPLFFQVVMDKVLVHKGLTTLEVLAIGFFFVAIFDAVLGGIRNYTLSHTTNRVDVELGAKLYNHLMGLPLPYFEARIQLASATGGLIPKNT